MKIIDQKILTQLSPVKILPLLLVILFFNSCQKEVDYEITSGGTTPPVVQKPKLGTVWTYRYYTFYSLGGGLATSEILVYKAKSEEVFGGEKWLRVVDVATDTTVFLLKEKPDGLYQYINNGANLLCKYPASINDTYNTFYSGETEDFIVKGVNDTLATDIGNIPTNYYETFKDAHLIDQLWYNQNVWIVWRQVNRKGIRIPPPSTLYFKYSTLYLYSIVY